MRSNHTYGPNGSLIHRDILGSESMDLALWRLVWEEQAPDGGAYIVRNSDGSITCWAHTRTGRAEIVTVREEEGGLRIVPHPRPAPAPRPADAGPRGRDGPDRPRIAGENE